MWTRRLFCLSLLQIMLMGSIILIAPPVAATKPLAEPQSTTGYWFPYGPAPLRNCGGGSPPDECSGRISAIVIDPRSPNTIYIGSATGGVWKTIDGGSTWTPLTDNLTEGSLAIGALAIDSNGVLYAGTGDGNWAFYGSGILKSSDGGITWSRLGVSTFGRSAITKIAIDPNNSNKIFVTANWGYTRASYTEDVYVDPGVKLGVFLSTDRGNTWSLSYATRDSDFDHQAWDVVVDPTNPSTVYAAVDGGVILSRDGGSTWQSDSTGLPSSNKVGRVNLGMSLSSTQTLYAALQYYDGSEYGIGRLYQTTNGGGSWSNVTAPPAAQGISSKGFCGDQCYYDLYVAVDPADPNTVYLGGLDLYRSTNGGTSWTDLGGYTTPGYIHEDQHALTFSSVSHTAVYIGNDGGIWSSNKVNSCSPSSCWKDLNSGLGITQFYSIAVDPKDSSHLIGGTQDNGCLSHEGLSLVWTEDDNCGDGGWTAFDPSNPKIIYEAQSWSCYSTGCTALYRTENGGATWDPIDDGLSSSDKGNFLVPLAIDEKNPSILYLGTTNLYETTNGGGQWFKPHPGLSLPVPDHCYDGECISAIAVAPSAGNFVYVGTTTGKIYTSADQGQHFTLYSGLPSEPVTQLIVDPTNPIQAYATFSGFGNGHVFSSSNGGSSWNDISSNLPDDSADSITLSPDSSSIYVGTDRGVYVSVNDGVSWSAIERGLPHVPVMDLKFGPDGRLWAATYGRGAWAYSPKILVTFGNVPPNATVTVDGISYTGWQISSQPFNWDPESMHVLQVQPIEMGPAGIRYVFLSWSDGSTELSRIVRANRPGDYSPIFKTQYLLTVLSDFDNPQGEGWYDYGTMATYSISTRTTLPGIIGALGAQASFISWSNGITAPSSTAIMYGPITVQARWRTDYTLAYITSSSIFAIIVATSFFLVRRRKQSGDKTLRRPAS